MIVCVSVVCFACMTQVACYLIVVNISHMCIRHILQKGGWFVSVCRCVLQCFGGVCMHESSIWVFYRDFQQAARPCCCFLLACLAPV